LFCLCRKKKSSLLNGSSSFAVILDVSPELAHAIDQAHWIAKPARQIAVELRKQTA